MRRSLDPRMVPPAHRGPSLYAQDGSKFTLCSAKPIQPSCLQASSSQSRCNVPRLGQPCGLLPLETVGGPMMVASSPDSTLDPLAKGRPAYAGVIVFELV